MTKLTVAQLKTAEAVLAKKYRGIVRDSLTNVSSKGRFRDKRTIKVVCPYCKGKPILTSTQELFHLVCDHCGLLCSPRPWPTSYADASIPKTIAVVSGRHFDRYNMAVPGINRDATPSLPSIIAWFVVL